ncbi:hypothetical protein LMG9964_02305 [Paraburkholderia phenoliruptrix]|nr:hypothetical protein LMG9964_02305 [Paraburkholderia phenoliruptrix]
MAGATALIHDRDPEEAQHLIEPVVALMMKAVHYYDGCVGKSLGDGILAPFGTTVAHEDLKPVANVNCRRAGLRWRTSSRHTG